MSEMLLYLTGGVAMLISAAAVGTLGFVANCILPGPASFVRGLLMTFVLVLAAGVSGFIGTTAMQAPDSYWAIQTAGLILKTVLGTGCGYALVRTVAAAKPVV